MTYTMEDLHNDGVHDGEMFKWEHMCPDCASLVGMALDAYEAQQEG